MRKLGLFFVVILLIINHSTSIGDDIFTNENGIQVLATPPAQPTEFTLTEPMKITLIRTYHYNSGKGISAGTISLKSSGGKVFGPYKAEVYNKYYLMIKPGFVLPADKYTIIDSDNSSWSNNVKSGKKGFALVQGEKLDFGTKGPVQSLFNNTAINWTKGPVNISVFSGINSDNSKLLSFGGPGTRNNTQFSMGNDYNTIYDLNIGLVFDYICYFYLPENKVLNWKDYIFFTDDQNGKFITGEIVYRGFFKNHNAHVISLNFTGKSKGSGFLRMWAFDYESKQLIGPKLLKYIVN